MARFTPNPMFESRLDRAIGYALEDLGDDIRRTAQSNTEHRSVARRIKAYPMRMGSRGPYVQVTTGGGLGNIFERGTATRRTRSGANRGSIEAEEAIGRAVDSEVPKGLDLSRYL